MTQAILGMIHWLSSVLLICVKWSGYFSQQQQQQTNQKLKIKILLKRRTVNRALRNEYPIGAKCLRLRA